MLEVTESRLNMRLATKGFEAAVGVWGDGRLSQKSYDE